jgi:hypothetical protein
MNDESKTDRVPTEKEPQEIQDADHDSGSVSAETEPWLPIETKLVVVSIATGVAALIVLATLVNLLLLGER